MESPRIRASSSRELSSPWCGTDYGVMDGIDGHLHVELVNVTVPSANCTVLHNIRVGPWTQAVPGSCAWSARVLSKTGPQPIFTMKDTTVANTLAAAMGSVGGGLGRGAHIKHK